MIKKMGMLGLLVCLVLQGYSANVKWGTYGEDSFIYPTPTSSAVKDWFWGTEESYLHSMLYHGAERRLAPGYDLVSTVFWPALAKTPAMKIGGSDSVDSLCLGHWKKLSQELNLGFAQLLRRLKRLCGSIQKTTCEELALPQECAPVLDLVQMRATRIVASLA